MHDFEFQITENMEKNVMFLDMYNELLDVFTVNSSYILDKEDVVFYNHLRFVFKEIDLHFNFELVN